MAHRKIINPSDRASTYGDHQTICLWIQWSIVRKASITPRKVYCPNLAAVACFAFFRVSLEIVALWQTWSLDWRAILCVMMLLRTGVLRFGLNLFLFFVTMRSLSALKWKFVHMYCSEMYLGIVRCRWLNYVVLRNLSAVNHIGAFAPARQNFFSFPSSFVLLRENRADTCHCFDGNAQYMAIK